MDGVEVHELHTNPLVSEFDGTVTVLTTLTGSQTNNVAGIWEIQGTELLSKQCRGFVEYTLDYPEQEIYGLNSNAAHLWRNSSCTPAVPVDTSAFLIYVDGIYVGKYPLVSADGVYVDVRAFLPVLPAGEHTVRLFWENVHSRLSLKINTLELQSFGGPDTNGNGVKDWVETSVAAMAGVDPITESVVSPACIEGGARYVPLAQIVDGASCSVPVEQSVGQRWYANLPLNEDGITQTTATFQNGAFEQSINIEWVPFNLIARDGEILLIRTGDSVKFVALPDDPNGGQFEIEYQLGSTGETVRSPNTHPLIHHFPEAGTYTISGQYTHGNDITTASVQVQVLAGTFPAENPACLVGREREWSFQGMSSNVVYDEVDETVELSVLGTSQTSNSTLQTVALKANDTNGDHVILARIYPGGPVLDSARLHTCWIQNAVDGYFYVVERYEDSELWEVNSLVKNLPDTVDLQIKVIRAGVTLDDYTLERWITNADYDETGSYDFRLFHPNDTDGSTCHTFKAYQGGVMIGEAFSGGQNDIGEE